MSNMQEMTTDAKSEIKESDQERNAREVADVKAKADILKSREAQTMKAALRDGAASMIQAFETSPELSGSFLKVALEGIEDAFAVDSGKAEKMLLKVMKDSLAEKGDKYAPEMKQKIESFIQEREQAQEPNADEKAA